MAVGRAIHARKPSGPIQPDGFLCLGAGRPSFGLEGPGWSGSDPVAGNVSQLFFDVIVDALGKGLQEIVDTARPAVEKHTASGALDDQRLAAVAAARWLGVHGQSFQGRVIASGVVDGPRVIFKRFQVSGVSVPALKPAIRQLNAGRLQAHRLAAIRPSTPWPA